MGKTIKIIQMERLQGLNKQLTGNVDMFSHLKLAPADPILGTTVAWRKDPNEKKINLGVGAYRTNEGKPYIFKAVQKAEQQILDAPQTYNHEYLSIDGYQPFVQSAQRLAFGADAACVKEGRVCSSQVLSGTGGLRVGFEFLRLHYPSPVYVPNPTWGNHNAIIQASGLPLRTYPYWDAKTRGLDFTGMCSTL